MKKEPTILLFGTRLAKRCQARSKQRGGQCRNAIAKGGNSVCRFHGFGGGPKTKEGRERIAAARTIHGRASKAKRQEYKTQMAELYALEEKGRALGIIVGPRVAGRRPKPI